MTKKKKPASHYIDEALRYMTKDQLAVIVRATWEYLWTEDDCMDPDKQWDAETPSLIADVLDTQGLHPANLIRARRKVRVIDLLSNRPCLYDGANPRKLRMEVQHVGEEGRYNEIAIAFMQGKKCVADICVGLANTPTTEARVLTSVNGESDEHIVAIYPERPAETCVDLEGA